MNRKKVLWGILIFIEGVVTVMCSAWGIRIYLREQDPRWQATKEIYKVQTVLQEVDGDWELDSLSKVIPYEIRRTGGPSIYYYSCITTYLNEEPKKLNGLNTTALSQVVDVDLLEDKHECKVGTLDAVMGELAGQTYLCWTISPKYSCVISYTPGTVAERDIFQIAESVKAVMN